MTAISTQAHDLLSRLGVAKNLYTEGTLIARSPVDGAVTGRVVESTAAEMQAAIGKAHAAFLEWRVIPAPKRGELVRRFGEVNTMVIPLWLWSLPMLGLAATRSAAIAIAMYFLIGVGTGLWIATNTTVRQRITPPELLGRMSSIYRTVSWGVVPFGAAFGGFAAHQWGLLAPFVIAGVASTPLALFGRRILRPVGEAPAWDATPVVSRVAGNA